ncbi:DUF2510 domain-containing protein [Cellulomonas sp. McL0617]|uniref:DUF2510 domain-containing protein n=1 Tax=Cellulomonas sp. McL0617 TaxID=3415675 RepID=UPI003CF256EB
MADSPLPAAGWYADGSTVGVHRWFDGTTWTEHTRPEPAQQLAFAGQSGESRFASADPRFATTTFESPVGTPATSLATQFGASLPTRLGLAMSPADLADRDAAFSAHRVGEARRMQRGAIGAFGSALAILVATSGISLALKAPDELWAAGGLGAGYLVWRALRDYGRSTFHGAPRLSVVSIALATVGLVATIGLFVAVPVVAAQQASHAVDDVGGLTGLSGLTGLPTVPAIPDPTG